LKNFYEVNFRRISLGHYAVVNHRAQRPVSVVSAVISNLNVEGIPAFVEFLLKEEIPFVLDLYKETPCSAGDTALRVEPDKIIRSMKAAYAVIERYLPPQSMLDSLMDLTRLGSLHDRPCGVGQNYIAFDPRGKAVKCQMAFEDFISDSSRPDPLADLRADAQGIQDKRLLCQIAPGRPKIARLRY
jgi:uncharacterized protein